MCIRDSLTVIPFLIFAQTGHFDVMQLINSVNKDSLEQTIRELSGEKPITINGKTDAMQSRYHLLDDITKVHQYLQDRLEKYPLDVEVQPFSLDEIKDLQFCKKDTAVGWLITYQGSDRTLSLITQCGVQFGIRPGFNIE